MTMDNGSGTPDDHVMADLPHLYETTATAEAEGQVRLDGPGLPTMASAPPAEFGGPGDLWSPETYLTAAVADCFVLSFRGIARASKLDWKNVTCHVTGHLDRVDRHVKFTKLELSVRLTVADGTDPSRAERLLEKAEKSCLITNSLTAEVHLDASVEVG